MGGVPLKDHIKLLKSENLPTIIVGTPGRVWELVEKKILDLKKIKHFILDECDRLLAEEGNHPQ